jgi:hypothetical protein
MMRCILVFAVAGLFTACGDSHHEAGRKDSHHRHSGGRSFGQKTSRTFHRVGGHLQKFFTGKDTLSR